VQPRKWQCRNNPRRRLFTDKYKTYYGPGHWCVGLIK